MFKNHFSPERIKILVIVEKYTDLCLIQYYDQVKQTKTTKNNTHHIKMQKPAKEKDKQTKKLEYSLKMSVYSVLTFHSDIEN